MGALDIITVAELKTHLNKSNATDDTELAFFVTTASAKIDELAGPVIQRSVTQIFSGGTGWKRTESLRQTPVVSVTSVTESGNVLDPSLYTVDLVTGVFTRGPTGGAYRTPFPPGTNNIVVVYIAGRTTAAAGSSQLASDAPTLRLACLELAAHWWRTTQYARAGNRGGQLGGGDADSYALHAMGFAVPNRVNELIGNQGDIPGVA